MCTDNGIFIFLRLTLKANAIKDKIALENVHYISIFVTVLYSAFCNGGKYKGPTVV